MVEGADSFAAGPLRRRHCAVAGRCARDRAHAGRDGRRPSHREGAVFTREALGSTSSSWSRELRELDARAQVWIRANAPRFSAGASGLSIMSAHVSQRSIDSRLGGTISAMVIGARRRGPGQTAD